MSALTFGSMRLDPTRTSKDQAVRLFEMLHNGGVTTFHSSYEYDSFPYFCECLATFRKRRPAAEVQHIVKLPAPHFDEERFSPKAFTERIHSYLKALDAERLDVVQWLVRQMPNTIERRAHVLERAEKEVEDTWSRLQREGKVGALASFPYDPQFADEVLDLPSCEGLVTYLNLAETEYVRLADSTGMIAIRPLFAGLLTPKGLGSAAEDQSVERRRRVVSQALDEMDVSHEDAPSLAIQFCLMHENVASAIVGISTENHARELLRAGQKARPDRKRFHEIADLLSTTKAAAC